MAEITEKQKNTESLSEKQKRKALAWLIEKLGNDPKCPMCSQSNWHLANIQVRVQAPNALLGGRGFPLIAMICQNCGNTQFLNMLVMGLLEKQPSEEESDG